MNQVSSPASDIDAIVLFGASGDLTRKFLIPALYRLEETRGLPERIVGVALDSWDDEAFRKHAADALKLEIDGLDASVLKRFTDRLHYVSGDYESKETFRMLADVVGRKSACLVYLAIPPGMFETVVSALGEVGISAGSRVLVEKPFGHDLESARELNQLLHSYLDESDIYRIDHFLGKEQVENILTFRFANPIFDAVWNRDYIDHIEITMAESFGVEDRGALYDSLGVVRDVVQNHLLQVVCLLTMEAPAAYGAESFAEARMDVLRTMQTVAHDEVVFGQYQSYRDTENVAGDSNVATFVALTLAMDHPRWRDVPISIRAGKSMATTATEAVVVFRTPPPLGFAPEPLKPEEDRLVFGIGPEYRVDLQIQTKVPGYDLELATVPLTVNFDTRFPRIPLAYEHVLHDALAGERSQFAREDAVEEAWRIVDGIVDPSRRPHVYRDNSWGPKQSQEVLDGGRQWIDPRNRDGGSEST